VSNAHPTGASLGSAVLPSERCTAAWSVLANVPDPELPTVSLCDLGIVRDVHVDGGVLQVVLTPTYSGCPATEVISHSVQEALLGAGLGPVSVKQQLAPAWTTDWISESGREKLLASGIAPPNGNASMASTGQAQPLRFFSRPVACPRCGSGRTERLSAYGSTACKSMHRCLACLEPFEHFKPI